MGDLPLMHCRSASGTPLYEKACSACGRISLVDKRKLGKLCLSCANKARATHGLSGHHLFKVLLGIKARCTYPSATGYAYYGGRGIKLCPEWAEHPGRFVDWAEARGWRKGLEVDRLNPDGDYSPENCRLLDHRQNSQRTRRIKTTLAQASEVKMLLRDGATIKDAAARSGVTYMAAWHIKNSPGAWENA